MATLAQQWIEEGSEKEIQKGMLEDARGLLRKLLREAVVWGDLNGFKKALQEAPA